MKKGFLYKVSPCMLAVAASLIFVIEGMVAMKSSGGWSFIEVIVFFPAMIIAFILDLVLKTFIKDTATLWFTELLIILASILLYYSWAKGYI